MPLIFYFVQKTKWLFCFVLLKTVSLHGKFPGDAQGRPYFIYIIKRSINLFVTAFAALSVFGTPSTDALNGISVMFQTIVTEIGSNGNFNGMTTYTCPFTAAYFIYYRLLLFTGDAGCGVNLVVGDETREVNVYTYCCALVSKCLLNCFINISLSCVLFYSIQL